jgi:hypothetical protein
VGRLIKMQSTLKENAAAQLEKRGKGNRNARARMARP